MPKSLSTKIINRFMNSFALQSVRRTLRASGVPRISFPIILGLVREVNRHIQWGNTALWRKRIDACKQLFGELRHKQNEVSPVYRFRGGSKTVNPFLSQETVRDKMRDPHRPTPGKSIDSSTLFLGGLGFVILASMLGPELAKRINTIDPLDARESQIVSSKKLDLTR